MKNENGQSISVALLLSFSGGFLDVYTYLARGKVFANTQTGNLVLLGYSLANGRTDLIIYYTLPIISFMIGISITEICEHKIKSNRLFTWQQYILLFEIIGLYSVTLIPVELNIFANIFISFICGLQAQAFRTINGKSYSTIMFTGNLKSAAERLSNFVITKDRHALKTGLIFLMIILMFISGAFAGAILTQIFNIFSIAFIDIIIILAFILLFH